jgi:hypothetical protein
MTPLTEIDRSQTMGASCPESEALAPARGIMVGLLIMAAALAVGGLVIYFKFSY